MSDNEEEVEEEEEDVPPEDEEGSEEHEKRTSGEVGAGEPVPQEKEVEAEPEEVLTLEQASGALSHLGKAADGLRYAYLALHVTGRRLCDISAAAHFKHLHFIDVSDNRSTASSRIMRASAAKCCHCEIKSALAATNFYAKSTTGYTSFRRITWCSMWPVLQSTGCTSVTVEHPMMCLSSSVLV